MKKIFFLLLSIPLISTANVEEIIHATDQPLTQLDEAPKSNDSKPAVETPSAPEKLKETVLGSFKRFVTIFLILLNNPKVQNGIKAIEKMMGALVQTALQVIKTSNVKVPSNSQEVTKKLLKIDPRLAQTLLISITKNNLSISEEMILRGHHHAPNCSCPDAKNSKPDHTTEIVLGNFAGIVNNFLGILQLQDQDKKDPEKLAPHLMGMLNGIVNIGVNVIKSGNLDIDNITEEEITRCIADLDNQFKEQIAATIHKTIHRSQSA